MAIRFIFKFSNIETGDGWQLTGATCPTSS